MFHSSIFSNFTSKTFIGFRSVFSLDNFLIDFISCFYCIAFIHDRIIKVPDNTSWNKQNMNKER